MLPALESVNAIDVAENAHLIPASNTYMEVLVKSLGIHDLRYGLIYLILMYMVSFVLRSVLNDRFWKFIVSFVCFLWLSIAASKN